MKIQNKLLVLGLSCGMFFSSLVANASEILSEEVPAQFSDLCTASRCGLSSDVAFRRINVGVLNRSETDIKLDFSIEIFSPFGSKVKFDVQRVFTEVSGNMHFVIRPIPADDNGGPTAGGTPKLFWSHITLTLPASRNTSVIYVHAITGDSLRTTSIVQPPVLD